VQMFASNINSLNASHTAVVLPCFRRRFLFPISCYAKVLGRLNGRLYDDSLYNFTRSERWSSTLMLLTYRGVHFPTPPHTTPHSHTTTPHHTIKNNTTTQQKITQHNTTHHTSHCNGYLNCQITHES